MRSVVKRLVLAAAAVTLLAVPTAVSAEGPAVLQVVIVEVDPAKGEDYLKELEEAQGIVKRLGLPAFRVWQSTLAGPNTGNIAIAIESPDMAAFAANGAKLQADEEWQEWVEDIQDSDISSVTSNSLLVEVTP